LSHLELTSSGVTESDDLADHLVAGNNTKPVDR
jgi:hypothetical protein